MAWQDLFSAFALYLILEGLLPFASPQKFRQALNNMLQLSDKKLHILGVSSIAAGVILLYWVR